VSGSTSKQPGRAGFGFFTEIVCIRQLADEAGEQRLRQRWAGLGLGDSVELVQAVPTPAEPYIGMALTHRRLVEAAQARGSEAILVFGEGALWLDGAATIVSAAAAELARWEWDLLILGGWLPLAPPLLPGCRHLARAAYAAGLHAVAYGKRGYARLLTEWPSDAATMAGWHKGVDRLDAYAASVARTFAVQPRPACLPELLPFQEPELQGSYS